MDKHTETAAGELTDSGDIQAHYFAIIEDSSLRVLLSVRYSSKGEPLSHVITRTSGEQID